MSLGELTLSLLFAGGHVGTDGYFDYVGSRPFKRSYLGDKPITEFLRTNEDLPSPVSFAQTMTDLRDLMLANAANGYNPDHIMVNGSSIYTISGDWGIDLWNSSASFKEGDIVLDNSDPANPSIFQFNSLKELTVEVLMIKDPMYFRMEHGCKLQLQRQQLMCQVTLQI